MEGLIFGILRYLLNRGNDLSFEKTEDYNA